MLSMTLEKTTTPCPLETSPLALGSTVSYWLCCSGLIALETGRQVGEQVWLDLPCPCHPTGSRTAIPTHAPIMLMRNTVQQAILRGICPCRRWCID